MPLPTFCLTLDTYFENNRRIRVLPIRFGLFGKPFSCCLTFIFVFSFNLGVEFDSIVPKLQNFDPVVPKLKLFETAVPKFNK
jgi:hypothetical protein